MSNGKGNIEVMRETLKQVNKLFILLYFFIIPAKYSSYILLSFIVCSVGMIVISALRNGKLKLKKSFFLLFVRNPVLSLGRYGLRWNTDFFV